MAKSTERTFRDSIESVVFFTNHGIDPCAHLRLRGPMHHLGIKVVDGNVNRRSYPRRVLQGDVVIIQRDYPRDLPTYEKVLQTARQTNKPVVYDIDDLLLLMPEEHPERQSQHYVESLLPILQAVHEADLVTTTTPVLRDWLLQYNPNVQILPNFFDDSIWQFRNPEILDHDDRPLIIGYMGSESHMPDLEMILPVLESLINKYPVSLELHFWGIKPPLKIANFPQVKWIPAVAYEYIDFAKYFQTLMADIFLAPLCENFFNRSKSPLKFFEYSALGVPGVYSKIEPFEQVITHGREGFLASSIEDWYQYTQRLIEDSELRRKLALNAQDTIQKKWLLSKNAFHWLDVYSQVAQGQSLHAIEQNQRIELFRSFSRQYYSLLEEKSRTIQNTEEIIISKDKTIQTRDSIILGLSAELTVIKTSKAWKIVLFIRKIKDILAPPNSSREKLMNSILQWFKDRKTKQIRKERQAQLDELLQQDPLLYNCHQVQQHEDDIDIIVCVHNALDDVQKCLESIITYTSKPYTLTIIDDGSDLPTRDYLRRFNTSNRKCNLIRNEMALGYTKAANLGLRASQAPFLVLLNSDTIVTPGWLDRLYRAITRNPKNGVAGPLSNTASWQSIPKLSNNGDWATNELPEGISLTKFSTLLAKYTGCIYPPVPLLNGFCLMIRKQVIDDIGYFDEVNFGRGYGEEDDFNMRATKAGWNIIISDDAYIYHTQSKSYTTEKRFALQKISGKNLINKHGAEHIARKVGLMNPNRVMEGIRSRSQIMAERDDFINRGRNEFANKNVLFVLPVLDAGGGANVILDEARCMLEMGVNVKIFNLSENRSGFLENYSHIKVPYAFGKIHELSKLGASFDAVIASANYSVPWLEPLQALERCPILGYYVQGFEPLMYQEGSDDYQQAVDSYTMISGIKRFTKTQWTRNEVFQNTGADSTVVGISINIDLFRPRDIVPLGTKPVTVVAMIRPGSPYRNPEMTLEILKQVKKKYKDNVDIWLFGADDARDVVENKYLDFKWRQLGKLTQYQVASIMSKADIFADFSSHQAMGLAALEAMSTGCSVIVPKNGGAVEFVTHYHNGIIADTSFFESSLYALEELIENDELRKNIQINGIHDVVQYYPEKVSYNILATLIKT